VESDGWVGLSDAVRSLRSELTAAMAEGEGERLRFELDAVEMEFLLEVRSEGGVNAGVKFYVITVGATHGVSSGSTHRLKLSFTPKDVATGRMPQISDEE